MVVVSRLLFQTPQTEKFRKVEGSPRKSGKLEIIKKKIKEFRKMSGS